MTKYKFATGIATVHVCQTRDIECGDRPQNWCKSCPKADVQSDGEFITEAIGRLCNHLRSEGKPILADCLAGLIKQRDTLKTDAAIGRLVREKLVSGNGVPVERCTIRADEVAAIANQEPQE